MPKKVLVVDDEGDVRKFLTAILEKHGYETLTAEDGTEALEIARREKPDLVTLDLQMPGLSGEEVLDYLRKRQLLHLVKVLIVSGMSEQDLERAMESGAHGVIQKPFDIEELQHVVKELLEKKPLDISSLENK